MELRLFHGEAFPHEQAKMREKSQDFNKAMCHRKISTVMHTQCIRPLSHKNITVKDDRGRFTFSHKDLGNMLLTSFPKAASAYCNHKMELLHGQLSLFHNVIFLPHHGDIVVEVHLQLSSINCCPENWFSVQRQKQHCFCPYNTTF